MNQTNKTYKLVWKDDFLVDGKPDEQIWSYETGGNGFGNNEDQFYTDRLKNAFVKDGKLQIVAYKETYMHRNYTSAKLTTYLKKSIKYGKVIVTAKIPKGQGTWPAIWLLPNSIHTGMSWPLCGEIDLMEHVGKHENQVHFSLHSKKYNHKINTQLTYYTNSDATNKFCRYEMRWDEEKIAFYLDDIHQVTFNKTENSIESWPFDQEFYLIINLAIGGWWGGKADDSLFPVTFEIDKVEVYEMS